MKAGANRDPRSAVRRAARWALLGSALAACADAPQPPATVTDSSGVRIIAFADELFRTGRPWPVDSMPRLSIGVVEGAPELELDRVVAAHRLADGSIVIADGGARELRVFSPDGRFLLALGGAGEGPGELAGIGWLQVVRPDTLVVIDPGLARVSFYTPRGFVRSVDVPITSHPWSGDFRLSDGTFVLVLSGGDVWDRIRAGTALAGTTDRNTATIVRDSQEGATIDTVGRFPGYEEAILERDGSPSTMYAPWGRNITFALTPDDRIVIGTQEEGRVSVHDLDGRTTTVMRWPTGDLTVTDGHMDAFFEALVQGVDDPGARQMLVARLRDMPRPPSRAAYGRILVDSRGHVWISEAVLPTAAPAEWRAIDTDDGTIGRVRLPDGVDLLEAGPDYVLGRSTDDLGVQRVVLYGLRRGS